MYHHDKDGNSLFGDKQELIRLIKSGRPVRIYWPIRDDFIHISDAGFLTIMGEHVFAQTASISRQIPDRKAGNRIALDASEQNRWHAIFSTTRELRSFQSTQGKLADHRFELKWFVFTPEHTKCECIYLCLMQSAYKLFVTG